MRRLLRHAPNGVTDELSCRRPRASPSGHRWRMPVVVCVKRPLDAEDPLLLYRACLPPVMT